MQRFRCPARLGARRPPALGPRRAAPAPSCWPAWRPTAAARGAATRAAAARAAGSAGAPAASPAAAAAAARAAGSAAAAGRQADEDWDVIVVGAGFAGLYALHRLRGLGFRACVLEAGSGVGGTWFWNRYPGARCDIESLEYSYGFDADLQREWRWSERFAPQPEILRYLQHVADRFDLLKDIQFNATVLRAELVGAARWEVETSDGAIRRSQFVIMALGCLSATNMPNIAGLGAFAGRRFHTGRWPAGGVDVAGRRVAVVGTGSSGVQAIPCLADEASELYVFQRTAGYVVPARNAPLSAEHEADVKARYAAFRQEAKSTSNGHHPGSLGIGRASAMAVSESERRHEYERRWIHGGVSFLNAFVDLATDAQANATASDFVRSKIREIVLDPQTAELLCPKYIIGGKRLCVGTNYYETFNRPHVTLVDTRGGIEEVTPSGIKVGGREYHVDDIVFATGYDAMTGSILRIDVRGRGGLRLCDKWSSGPLTYLGLAVAGFPNMFVVTGPGSPSVLTNMPPSIEHHVEWIASCLAHVRALGARAVEADEEAESAWSEHVQEAAGGFLRAGVDSWYLGANVQGKPRVFMPYMGGFASYVRQAEDVAARGYEGFACR